MTAPRMSIALLLAFSGLAASTTSADVVYVNAAATGANNGTSWADAFTSLQDGLADAGPGDEVWVARGVYKPTAGTDRTIRFTLLNGASIYGGFAGTEANPSERPTDPDPGAADPAWDTVLSGDIGAPGFGDNSEGLMVASGAGGGTVIDRLVFTQAEFAATNRGTLMFGGTFPGEALVSDCLFIENRGGRGTGVHMFASTVGFERCVFIDNLNTNDIGGGIYASNGSLLRLQGCVFRDNRAAIGSGGAIYLSASNLDAQDCEFTANTAQIEGGAAVASNLGGFSSAVFLRCSFDENMLSVNGSTGGAVCIRGSSGVFEDCDFTDNFAREGGAIGGQSGGLISIDGSRFSGNTAQFGGALRPAGALLNVSNSEFVGNSAGTGGALMTNFGGMTEITDSVFRQNTTTAQEGGAAYLAGQSATFVRCDFDGNSSMAAGGAVLVSTGAVRFDNSTFTGNSAPSGAGGTFFLQSGHTVLAGCLFVGNSAGSFGSVVSNSNGTASVINCTFVGNSSSFLGSPIRANAAIAVANSIFRDNIPAGSSLGGPGASATYSNIPGGFAGTGNFDADPLFADPAGGDYRLLPGSPCIDAGDNTAVPAELTADLAGLPRFIDDPDTTDTGAGVAPIVDVGAYEFQIAPPPGCPGDANGDGLVNAADLSVLLSSFGQAVTPGSGADYNGDGVVNAADLSVLLSNFGTNCNT